MVMPVTDIGTQQKAGFGVWVWVLVTFLVAVKKYLRDLGGEIYFGSWFSRISLLVFGPICLGRRS
jgi:hypothetical protein